MKVTVTDSKNKNKKKEVEASGLLVLFLCVILSPMFLGIWGIGWAFCTLLAVALTGFLHYVVLYIVDHRDTGKDDSQDLHGSL